MCWKQGERFYKKMLGVQESRAGIVRAGSLQGFWGRQLPVWATAVILQAVL
jgi:hypothetical protein